MEYLFNILKGVLGSIFVGYGIYYFVPTISLYININRGPLIFKLIKKFGFIENKVNKIYGLINFYILKPGNKFLAHSQEDLIFIHNGLVTNKYFKNTYNGINKPIKPYDAVLNLFYIEKNDEMTPYVQVLENFNKNNVDDNYKISNIKFIDIFLYNYGKKHRLQCKYNFYVCGNMLFKDSFIKWLIQTKNLDANYSLKIIDHEAKIITLTKNDYIIIKLNDYEVCRKTNEDSLELFTPSNVNKRNSSVKLDPDRADDDSDNDDSSYDSDDKDEDRYWSNIDTSEFSTHSGKWE